MKVNSFFPNSSGVVADSLPRSGGYAIRNDKV